MRNASLNAIKICIRIFIRVSLVTINCDKYSFYRKARESDSHATLTCNKKSLYLNMNVNFLGTENIVVRM